MSMDDKTEAHPDRSGITIQKVTYQAEYGIDSEAHFGFLALIFCKYHQFLARSLSLEGWAEMCAKDSY